MGTYVAFLRAINLGARRKFPKQAIAAATEAAGFTGVATHINTGNVRLETAMRSRSKIESMLEAVYAEHAGFEVRTIVFSAAELAAVAGDAAELNAGRDDLERHYIYLLKDEPEPQRGVRLVERMPDPHTAVVRGRAVHLLLGQGVEAGMVDPIGVERALGVVATSRNVNVVRTVASKWAS